LSEQEKRVVWATHFAPAADLFTQKLDGVAWKSKPSSYIVATKDRTVQPELQRFVAKRMSATTHEVASSHVPMLSNPSLVIDVIRTAAKAVQARATVAWKPQQRRKNTASPRLPSLATQEDPMDLKFALPFP